MTERVHLSDVGIRLVRFFSVTQPALRSFKSARSVERFAKWVKYEHAEDILVQYVMALKLKERIFWADSCGTLSTLPLRTTSPRNPLNGRDSNRRISLFLARTSESPFALLSKEKFFEREETAGKSFTDCRRALPGTGCVKYGYNVQDNLRPCANVALAVTLSLSDDSEKSAQRCLLI